jgi:HD-GYP domain-containing protein (c-di-GMP phosphodiesterase class II)
MSFSLTPEDVKKSTEGPVKPYAIGFVVWLAVAVAGLLLIGTYAVTERENAKINLQGMLGGVAQVRAGALVGWVQQQQAPLTRFAGDEDVRLSITQILQPSADLDLASRGYLRNWLASLARDNGYLPEPPSGDVTGSAQTPAPSGVAILSKTGDVLVSVGMFPAEAEAVKSFVREYRAGENQLLDLFKGSDGNVYIGFAQPLFGLGGGEGEEARIGLVLGIKAVEKDVYPLLRQPGALLQTAESVLLRRVDGIVQIISPVGSSAPLTLQFDAATQGLVEADAMRQPGSFSIGMNYSNVNTVSISRAVEGTPWVLAYQAAYAEVLDSTDRRLMGQISVFSSLLFLVLGFLYAAWRNGAARVAAEKAIEYGALARKLDFQSKLLRLVTDSQRNHILIADTEGRVRFVNATLAKFMETNGEDLIGKPLAAAVGPDAARRLGKRSQEASLSNKAIVTVDRIALDETDDSKFRVIQTQHIPLEDYSAGPDKPPARGMLIVEEDITDVVMEREKRERVLQGVVGALVSVVDRRDPFAAEHSTRVARLSHMLAAELGLSKVDSEAVEMAGELLNLGKLLVPQQILTKQGPLDEAELRVVRDSILASGDLVSKIEFEGPVVETLHQSLERVDGSGFPQGRVGDDIIVTARILAVANSFVALISPRAHRAGLPLDAAIEAILAQEGKAYDRGVIAALINYIDNKGGRSEWEMIAPPPVPEKPADDNPWQR